MKCYLLKSEFVTHPRAFLRTPDEVPEDLLRRYLETRNLKPVSVPHALLTLLRRFECGPVRKIKMSNGLGPFNYESKEN